VLEMQRNPDRDAEARLGMTGDPDSRGWTYYDFGTRDSYHEIFAFLAGQVPKPDDVFGQTRIVRDQQTGVTFPVVTVNPERVPLFGQQPDPETIRDVLVRVERIEASIFRETVALSAGLGELVANSVEAIRQAIAHRLVLALCYGIADDGTIAALRAVGERIVPGAPDACRIEVRLDDPVDLRARLRPKAEPEQKSDGDSR